MVIETFAQTALVVCSVGFIKALLPSCVRKENELHIGNYCIILKIHNSCIIGIILIFPNATAQTTEEQSKLTV